MSNIKKAALSGFLMSKRAADDLSRFATAAPPKKLGAPPLSGHIGEKPVDNTKMKYQAKGQAEMGREWERRQNASKLPAWYPIQNMTSEEMQQRAYNLDSEAGSTRQQRIARMTPAEKHDYMMRNTASNPTARAQYMYGRGGPLYGQAPTPEARNLLLPPETPISTDWGTMFGAAGFAPGIGSIGGVGSDLYNLGKALVTPKALPEYAYQVGKSTLPLVDRTGVSKALAAGLEEATAEGLMPAASQLARGAAANYSVGRLKREVREGGHNVPPSTSAINTAPSKNMPSVPEPAITGDFPKNTLSGNFPTNKIGSFISRIKEAEYFGKVMGKFAAGPYGNFGGSGGSGGATIANLSYKPNPFARRASAKDALMPYPSTTTNTAPASAGTRGGYNGLGGFGGSKPIAPTPRYESQLSGMGHMNLANTQGVVRGSPAYKQLLQQRAASNATEAAQRIAYEANRPSEGGLISSNLDMTTPGLARGLFQLGSAVIPAARAAISEGFPVLSARTLKGVAPAAKHFGKEISYHKGLETAADALTRGVPHAVGHAAPFAVPAHPGLAHPGPSRHDLQPER